MKAKLLKLAAGLVVVAVLAWVGRDLFGELPRLAQASPWLCLAVAATYLATRVLNGEAMRAPLRVLGHSIGLYEAFMISMAMTYTNLLVPRAGLGAPALYLKLRHGVRYADFGSLLLPLTVVQVICMGIVGLAAQGMLRSAGETPGQAAVAGLFAAVTVAGCAGLFFRLPVPDRWRNRTARFARRLSASWHSLSRSTAMMARVVAVQLGVVALRAVRLHLAFLALGIHVDPAGVLIASILGQFMQLVGLTPGGLGMREAAIAFSHQALGTTPDLALAAALLDRLVVTVAVVVVAQVGIAHVLRPVLRDAARDAKP